MKTRISDFEYQEGWVFMFLVKILGIKKFKAINYKFNSINLFGPRESK